MIRNASAINSLPHALQKSSENIDSDLVKKKMSLNDNSGEKAFLPNLIFNDRNRSSAYYRTARSSDFLNAKSSLLATRALPNWRPLERETTISVQSKINVYKPPKRIENPGRPLPPFRANTLYESIDTNFHNEKRALEMKRLKYLKDQDTQISFQNKTM